MTDETRRVRSREECLDSDLFFDESEFEDPEHPSLAVASSGELKTNQNTVTMRSKLRNLKAFSKL